MNEWFNKYITNRLEADNIDISSDDFIYSSVYNDYGNEFIMGPEKTVITLKWYIEKYLIDDTRLEKLYGSVYRFGVMRDLTEEEENFDYFCEVLRQYDNRDDPDEVRRSLMRNDGKDGLSVWIKNIFGVDVFNENYSTKEKYKVLYLFYTMQKDFNIELKALFKNPTLENMDTRFIGKMSNNGEFIGYIKDEFTKEVKDIVREEINATLLRVVNDWKTLFIMLHQCLNVYSHEICIKNLERILRVTDIEEKAYTKNNLVIDIRDEKYNLFERMYFEISKFEYIGMEKDIISVNKTDNTVDKRIEEIFKNVELDRFYKTIPDYELFIMDNLYEEIGLDIYQNAKLTSNERRKLSDSVERVNDIIGYITEKTDLSKYCFNYGMILSIFCFVIFLNKKETVDNRYYGYKKIHTLNTEINYGDQAHDKAKIFIVQRILNIYHKARGFENEINMIRKIEANIDAHMMVVFAQHGMDELLYVHGMLYQKIRRELFFDEAVFEKANEIILNIEKETGFKFIIVHNDSIFYMFRMYYDSASMLKKISELLIDDINQTLENGDVRNLHEIEMIDDDGYVSLGEVGVLTSLSDRKIILQGYRLIR